MSLTKPEEVAECSTAPGGCVNAPKQNDAGPDGRASDAGPPDNRGTNPGIDGSEPCIEGICYPVDAESPALDGAEATEDAAGIVVPDATADTPWVAGPEVEQPGQSDAAGDPPSGEPPSVVPDAPQVLPDGAADGHADVAPGICANGGQLKPAGTPCRPAVGPCDVAETCDGLNADCPADKLAAAGKECRPAAGDCDIAETCSGASGDCPADGFRQAGTVCREAADVCDYAEVCPGDSAACPNDALKQSSAVCREATNPCDPAESCTGLRASCPQDVPPYTRPAAPTTVSATPGELQATITWGAVSGATSYNIKRGTTAGGPYTTIATAVLASPFVDTGLDSTKTYYYVVSAVNTIASCESAASSAEVSAKPTGICVPPSAPTVTATPGNGQVTLNWGAIAGATAYAIDRSETSGTGYASLAQVEAPGTTYVDQAVTFGKTYFYRVTTKADCDSDPSAEVSAAPLCTPAAAAPTGLAATTPNTGGVVVLTWNAVSGAKTTDRYYVMRKLSSDATYARIDEVVPPTTTYSDTTAVNGTAYDYAVTYFNGTCTSANSNVLTATAACVMDKPVLTATAGDRKIYLSWTAPPNGSLTGYRVSRKTTGGYTVIADLTGAGTTTYSDSSVTVGTAYTYFVTALGNCNADSDAETATPFCTPPSVPGVPTATPGDTKVTLSWEASTPAPASYTVQRKTGAGGTYATIATPTTNSHSDDTPPLTNGTTYYYRISASNGTCSSDYNTEVAAIPQPTCDQNPPTNVAANPSGSVQITITWTAASPEPTTYNISRSTTLDGTYASVGETTDGTAVSYTDDDTSLTPDTTYYYRVSAIGSCSATSGAVSATTACSVPQVPGPIASNSNGTITVTWTAITGATGYDVYRSGSLVSGNQNDAYYTDTNVANGTQYSYTVAAANANHQCVSAQSTATTARSCVVPATPPTGLAAMRSGNRQVSLAWTNPPNGSVIKVRRSTTSGSGYQDVATVSGQSWVDDAATNTSPFYYVATAASHVDCPATGNSSQVSVPSCRVFSGGGSDQKQNDTSEWCLVTCDNVAWWNYSGEGDRTLFVNTSQRDSGVELPAKVNGGYAFYFNASVNGTGNYTYWNYGHSGSPQSCP
ncbi:MAG: hypothetical protein JXP73_04710 [Deltaproteobacteria bacterium]|nr:hypothetical protein [Deltaproteobacteria bacterium]